MPTAPSTIKIRQKHSHTQLTLKFVIEQCSEDIKDVVQQNEVRDKTQDLRNRISSPMTQKGKIHNDNSMTNLENNKSHTKTKVSETTISKKKVES